MQVGSEQSSSGLSFINYSVVIIHENCTVNVCMYVCDVQMCHKLSLLFTLQDKIPAKNAMNPIPHIPPQTIAVILQTNVQMPQALALK